MSALGTTFLFFFATLATALAWDRLRSRPWLATAVLATLVVLAIEIVAGPVMADIPWLSVAFVAWVVEDAVGMRGSIRHALARCRGEPAPDQR
jgi:uncharacterized membrane protein